MGEKSPKGLIMFNYDETYDRVFNKVLGPNMILPDFIDLNGVVKRTEKIVNYLYNRSLRLDEECCYCCKSARADCTTEVFDTPWEDEPEEKYFCSEKCQELYLYSGDFQYFTCDACGREICGQNPRNGWHVQYRCEDGWIFCLKCYEDKLFKYGCDIEKLKLGYIPGAFLEEFDLYNSGYGKVRPYVNYFIGSQNSKKLFIDKALELINNDYIIIINYENIAITGDEGYVSLWAKEKNSGTE
jgi:hypothetical protein